MRYLAIVAMLGCMTMLSAGQTKKRADVRPACRMTADQLPDIRGLLLGMSVSELLSAFPEESSKSTIQKAVSDAKKSDTYGFGRATLFPSIPVNPNFSGVEAISVELVDDRVSSFRLEYARGIPWKSADQFVSKISDAFHLPTHDRWSSPDVAHSAHTKGGAVDYGNRVLTCNGFTVLATINNGNGGSAIIVKNPRAEQLVNDRGEAAKERVRQAFKP